MALPTLYPQLNDPARNLAAAFDVARPIPTPMRRQYLAADGTSIGYGNDCDPITAEMALSGMDLEAWYDVTEYVPEAIQEKRITWMEAFSMPLTVAALGYGMNARPLAVAALSAASYMAPYWVALGLAYTAAAPRAGWPSLPGLGAPARRRNVRTARRKPRSYRPRIRRNVYR